MGVKVRLEGSLVARAGARQATVPVDSKTTVRDVVERLSERFGSHVEPAILEGNRLRSDTRAFRELHGRTVRLGPDSRVESGQTVRFEMVT